MMPRERIAAPAALLLAVLLAVAVTGEVARVVLPLLVAGGLLAACGITGRPVLEWLGVPQTGAVERAIVATVIGVGVIGALLFLLGLAGGLSPAAVLSIVAGSTLMGAVSGPPWRSGPDLSRAAAERSMMASPWARIAILAAVLWTAAVLAVAVLPISDWDTLMYHLPVPERFLTEGTVLGDPTTAHYGYVGLVHMLYVVCLSLGQPGAATVISGLFALLLAVFVFRIGTIEAGRGGGALAVAGMAGTTILAFVAITARLDVTLALFLFLTHWAVLRFARDGDAGFVVLAGLLAGTALATKVHAGAYLLPLALWTAWLLVRRGGGWRTPLLGVAMAILVAAPWLARNAMLFGDPLFPLLSSQTVPPWLEGYQGVEAAAESVRGGSVIGLAREPVTLRTLLFHQERLSPEAEAAGYVWSPLLLAGLLLVIVSVRTWRWAGPALACALLMLGWSARTNLRYLIPVVPALSIAAVVGLRGAVFRTTQLRRWGIVLMFTLAIAPAHIPLERVWRWVRNPVESGNYDTIYAASAAASRVVPEGGVLLMLYEGRVLPFEGKVLPDTRGLTWPLLYVSGYADSCLEGLPATHVLLNTGALAFYERRAGEVPHVSDGALARFVRRCLVEEDRRGGHVLYRVAIAAGADGHQDTGVERRTGQ